jgi:hypothetical protein
VTAHCFRYFCTAQLLDNGTSKDKVGEYHGDVRRRANYAAFEQEHQSAFGYYPKPGEVKKPDSSYDSLKVDLKIKSVTTLNLAGADVQELTEAVEEKLFNLPANASKPNCADGGTIHFWGQVGGRTHSSKASCDWTDEFQEFRELFGGILGNAT